MIKKKQEIIKSFKQYAVEGINRKTTIDSHKKRFKLKNEDIEWIIAACNFKPVPKDIDYLTFYNNQICSIATPITTSKAQIYCIENFLIQLHHQLEKEN